MPGSRVLPLNVHIHPTASVSPEAVLEAGVSVGPYALVGAGVHVGANTEIGPRAIIGGRARIGQRNRVACGAQLAADPLGDGESHLVIGDGNTIREYAIVTGGPADRPTRIGNNTFIMSFVRIGAGACVGDQVILTHSSEIGPETVLEDRVIISGLARVAGGVRIGTMTMVGGLSAVNQNVPPYLLVFGNPAVVHGINVVGLRRGGLPPASRSHIRRAFRLLYRGGLSPQDALARLPAGAGDDPHLKHFIEFLRTCHENLINRIEEGAAF